MLTIAIILAVAMQAPEPPLRGGNQQAEEILGWTATPPASAEGEETELDRLSRSSSGASFLPDLFGGGEKDPRIPVSVTLRALDKVTADFSDIEVPIGETATFGSLTLLPRTCSTRPPEEFPETTVFLEVYAGENDEAGRRAREDAEELPPIENVEGIGTEVAAGDGAVVPVSETVIRSIDEALYGEAIFKGWMFASSPSLNAMEHPTYDVWVIDCTMEDPDV